MNEPFRPVRAVRYACAVLTDFRIDRLPVDPFRLAADAGIAVAPLSGLRNHPAWAAYDLPSRMGLTRVITIPYPTFCIVYRDEGSSPEQLTLPLARELGHLFMNHYREIPDLSVPGRLFRPEMEREADIFARNLLCPVPVVDVIRYNRPQQARASLFRLNRSAWIHRLNTLNEDRASIDEETANILLYLFRDYLIARRCRACGAEFRDEAQNNACPFCGAGDPEWVL